MIGYSQLRDIDAQANTSTEYITDFEKYLVPEYWEIADEAGDCEDIMLKKIQALKAAGVPISDMRVGTCFARPFTDDIEVKKKRGHAVLLVKIDGEEYCLDNMTAQPLPADRVTHEFHKLQIPGTLLFEWAEGADRRFG